jgi:carboxypeptidase C (cathepsin A)
MRSPSLIGRSVATVAGPSFPGHADPCKRRLAAAEEASMRRSTVIAVLLALLAWAPVRAQDASHAPPPAVSTALPAEVTTTHTVRVGGRETAYTATAGALPLLDAKGEKRAEMAFVAYAAAGVAAGKRPISFVFNGGPGAASAYLLLGALGPRVIEVPDDAQTLPATPRLIDNPDSWLDATDLVFVDPIGAGYSRGVGADDETAKQFWGVRQDVEALAAFVRLYLTRADRLASPKYLVGESYGGFRAVRLAQQLQSEQGLAISGAILVSPVLEFETMNSSPYAPMGWALRLPSYAAAVLESEGRLSAGALAEVERFARGDYLSALVNGPRDPEQARRMVDQVARFTGLPRELVERHNGRVPAGLFIKEFRRADRKLISRYDASVGIDDPFPDSRSARGGDAVLQGSIAPFTTAFVTYVRDELGFRTDRAYRLLNGEIAGRWDWRSGGVHGFGSQGFVGSLDELRELLSLNPRLRVLVAHGMTDLVTPYFASRFLLDQLPRLGDAARVDLTLYAGGHMMYLRAPSRARLHADAAALYRATAPSE